MSNINKADLVEISWQVLDRSTIDTCIILETGFVADELGGAGYVWKAVETGRTTSALVQDIRKAKGDLEKFRKSVFVNSNFFCKNRNEKSRLSQVTLPGTKKFTREEIDNHITSLHDL